MAIALSATLVAMYPGPGHAISSLPLSCTSATGANWPIPCVLSSQGTADDCDALGEARINWLSIWI